MDFEWNEDKRQETLAKHRVDVLYAAMIFDGFVLTKIDDREDYGEVRLISIGLVDEECFVVIHTERGSKTRLITAWKGGRGDRKIYEERLARRSEGA